MTSVISSIAAANWIFDTRSGTAVAERSQYKWQLEHRRNLKDAVESAAQAVLDARAQYPNSSLADLYDPNTMPSDLLRAHRKLDRAVEKAYRAKPFSDDAERAAFLFERYAELTADARS